jgi:hypothetical protein
MADKPAEPKLYFKFLPKEQVFALFEAFKKLLMQLQNQRKKNV